MYSHVLCARWRWQQACWSYNPRSYQSQAPTIAAIVASCCFAGSTNRSKVHGATECFITAIYIVADDQA
jgi:hypothetical protein